MILFMLAMFHLVKMVAVNHGFNLAECRGDTSNQRSFIGPAFITAVTAIEQIYHLFDILRSGKASLNTVFVNSIVGRGRHIFLSTRLQIVSKKTGCLS